MLLINNNYYILGLKNVSTIQECHLILAKLMVLETIDECQSYSLIKLVNQYQHL
jgi:hypothetical protein